MFRRNILTIICCAFVATSPVLHAEESGSSVKDSILDAILNGSGGEQAKEFIAETLTERYRFLDVSYVRPEGNENKDGWNVNYDLQRRSGSGGGFSIESGTAKLEQIAYELDISGTYSYGSADNVEDYSTAKFAFSYLYGDFGKLRVIEKTESTAFQKCLADAPESDLTAEDKCWAAHKIDKLVPDPNQAYVLSVSATGGIEGEQNYQNKQYTYGIRGIFSKDRYPSIRLDYERIDASEDAVRTAITDDNYFDRVSGELGYRYPIFKQKGYQTWFYLSYRYFKELSPPDAIRDQGLDEYEFISASIYFPAKLLSFVETDELRLYIRYTDGELPFDRQSDKSVQLGFSTNISALGELFAE